jgi:hypothetical protein
MAANGSKTGKWGELNPVSAGVAKAFAGGNLYAKRVLVRNPHGTEDITIGPNETATARTLKPTDEYLIDGGGIEFDLADWYFIAVAGVTLNVLYLE